MGRYDTMKKFFSVGFATIASLLLIFAILFTSMELVLNNQTFIENEFTKLDISKTMGIGNTDLVKSTVRLIDYMQGDVPDIDVDVTLRGETVKMFELEQEVTHMQDVQKIYLQIKQYRDMGVLAMLVLFLFAAVINFKKAQQTLAQGYLSGAFIALLFIGFLGTWAASDFSSFWTFFHEALFWNDLWLFDATESRMINMLPEQMFADIVGRIFLYAGTAIAALIAASVLALVFTSKGYKKKRAESIKRQRARKAQAQASAKARAEARSAAKAEREKAKAEREKAKRKAARMKEKEKAQRKKGKGKKQPAQGSVREMQRQAAAAEEPLDDIPTSYAEDADGYPLDAIPPAEEDGGEEVASIDDILGARKKPWRESAAAEPEATARTDAPADTAAQPAQAVVYATLTEDGRIAEVSAEEYADVESGADDEEYIDESRSSRDSGRTPRPKARAKKASGLRAVQKAIAGASKARAEEKIREKTKRKKQHGNVQDDTGFFDE